MDAVQLAKLVKSTRNAQREYFKTRDKDVLVKSKRLEKELDAAIDVILGEAAFIEGGQVWADWNGSMLDFGD